MKPGRAWVLLPSGRRLNLLEPDPESWADRDLAIGLSRTYRWAGYSAWDLPLSVAQHSLTVLALYRVAAPAPISPAEAMREILHDATEALLGGWDPITPLKSYLGEEFRRLVARLQTAVNARYDLPPWDKATWQRHKHADRLAAASEAFHVAGWSRRAMQEDLQILLEPLKEDPLPPAPGCEPWEPWQSNSAAERFLKELQRMQDDGARGPGPVDCVSGSQ